MRAWELVRDAVGLHRLRDRLQHRGPPRRASRIYRLVPRAQPRRSTSTGCATRAASPTSACTTERLAAPLVGRRRRSTGTARSTPRPSGCARRSTPTPARSAWCFNAQATNEDHYALVAAGVRAPGRRQGLPGRPATRAGATTSCVSADKNPNTAGAIAIGAGRLRSLVDLADDLKAGALTRAAGASAPTASWSGRRAAAAMPLERLAGAGRARRRTRTAGRRPRHVALPLADVGRGRRHVHQPHWAWSSACAPRSPPAGRRAAGLGDPRRTWRASWAPRMDFADGQGGVPRGAAEAAVHEGRRLGPRRCCRSSCASPNSRG